MLVIDKFSDDVLVIILLRVLQSIKYPYLIFQWNFSNWEACGSGYGMCMFIVVFLKCVLVLVVRKLGFKLCW